MFCLRTTYVLVEDSLININLVNALAFYKSANHGCIQICIRDWLSCHEVGWMVVALLVPAARPESLKWCFNICECEMPGQFPAMFCWDGARWANPNQLLFEPKPNQTVRTATSQHKIENWTQRNVKLQHKELTEETFNLSSPRRSPLFFIIALFLHPSVSH